MATTGTVREITVTAGAPPGDDANTAIQINRLHINAAGVHTPLHSVYEIPASPSTDHGKHPTPRLDSGAGASGIFEVPPTPPNKGNASRSRVREISVASFDIPEAEGEAPIDAPEVKVEHQGKQPSQLDEKDVPRSKSWESSLVDFSLFLMKNAKMRDEIRSRTKGLSHGASQEPEDIEALLRRWEAAQAEEAAALEKKDSSVHVSVLPMFPSLLELPLLNFINFEGKINPQVDADTPVSVFAIFDRIKRVQYIGISTDIRDTMRKLMGRRPSLCYYYKLYNYPNVDNPQPQLLKERVNDSDVLKHGLPSSDTLHKGTWILHRRSSGSKQLTRGPLQTKVLH